MIKGIDVRLAVPNEWMLQFDTPARPRYRKKLWNRPQTPRNLSVSNNQSCDAGRTNSFGVLPARQSLLAFFFADFLRPACCFAVAIAPVDSSSCGNKACTIALSVGSSASGLDANQLPLPLALKTRPLDRCRPRRQASYDYYPRVSQNSGHEGINST
ncbi:hypothetical protein C8R46DRAFT_548334 [Mycena filopes]|nr:hypothetical protein C8R46DRAFT_548334 [Mycena filopes]